MEARQGVGTSTWRSERVLGRERGNTPVWVSAYHAHENGQGRAWCSLPDEYQPMKGQSCDAVSLRRHLLAEANAPRFIAPPPQKPSPRRCFFASQVSDALAHG